MTEIFIKMNETGTFTMDPCFGRIDEYCARKLRIALNSDFLSSSISYYTLSFEPYALSGKIITENIYRDSSTSDGIYYTGGCLICPIYDYIAVSPTVAVQIDAYETDSLGNVTAIIKSGIFTLEFAPSLTGEGMMLQTVRPDVKFYENVNDAVNKTLEIIKINGERIVNYSITENQIGIDAVGNMHLQEDSVSNLKIKSGAVTTRCLADGSVTSAKLVKGCVTNTTLAQNAVTTEKISDKNVTTVKLADSSVTSGKIADYSISDIKLKPLCVTTQALADGAVTPAKLDRVYLTAHQSLDGYATEEWVLEKNYLTEHQNLDGYATEDWVENKGYLTFDDGILKSEDLPEKLSELENDIAVSFVAQNLTDEQKETAIENIGAVKREEGKVLSRNDFTDADKEKLDKALVEHQDISMKADVSSLAEVAFSGSYNDLSDLPDGCSFTEDIKADYDKAYAHSLSSHAPVQAEENILESLTVNGKDIEIKEKNASFCVIGFEKKDRIFVEVY